MTVLVSRKAPKSAPLRSSTVARMAERMLSALNLEDSELSILLTNDAFMKEINFEHRGKDKPTDVLSFPQNEFDAPEQPRADANLLFLGDVVISVDTALRQAQSRKRPLEHEVCFLLAHGVMHLLGHDHADADEKKAMTKRTQFLVRSVRN